MIYLGKKQNLTVARETQFGFYLSGPELPETEASLSVNEVLLPRTISPDGLKTDDTLTVFVSMDSEDRPVATLFVPELELGGVARLNIKETTDIGAFLEWGLAKDLFLPYREQTHEAKSGDNVLVGMYIDKSGRLCATEKVYPFLSADAPYAKGAWVDGTVYDYIPDFGVYVAVDDIYQGMIPSKELSSIPKNGTRVHARVTIKHPDGKLELSLKDVASRQMSADGDLILDRLKEAGGFLPFNDKSAPELIRDELGMSKSAFKRAIGGLYKERRIEITKEGIKTT